RRQLPVIFTPGDANPEAANYTNWLYNNIDRNQYFVSQNQLAALNGVRNGDPVPTMYNLYANVGSVYPFYSENSNSQWRVTSSFNADIKKHALTVGFEADQRENRAFQFGGGFQNGAAALWTRMRQITNQHTEQLDTRPGQEIVN